MPSIRIVLPIVAVIIAAAAGAWWFLGSSSPGGGEVAVIKQSGTLTVGVRENASPFSRRDSDGNMVGLEPDLARDLAERLGVELELKPVKDEDRVQVLQDGEVDLVLAGLSKTDGLGDLVWFVEPAYYAGGANVLVRMNAGIDDWEDLKDVPVCAVQGAEYNERVAENYGARVVVFRDGEEALNAFDTGDCQALLSDESWLISLLVQPDYASYDVPLSHIEGRHWYVAIRHERPHLHKFIKRAVKGWHDSGKIVKLERKWNVRPSEFAARMHGGEVPPGAAAAGE
ncbi:MAG: transporter substrate-binding domain-containing protein [Alphaproteobacteria bacterium]